MASIKTIRSNMRVLQKKREKNNKNEYKIKLDEFMFQKMCEITKVSVS